MKNTNRNVIILSVAICFLTLDFIGGNTNAQTRPPVKATATPKIKKSTTSNSKTTPKSSIAAPKTTNTTDANLKTIGASQIIVTATAVAVREFPSVKSRRLAQVKFGKIFPVAEKKADFYRVEYTEGKSGWISISFTRDFEPLKRDALYREIVEKYTKNKTLDFATAVEIADFLRTAKASVKSNELQADLSLTRLRVLTAALKAIPFGKSEQNPYKTFLDANQKDVIYSDPSGEWLARSELFWDLRNKFAALPVAEEIAWEAAKNPLPGECEGYINCNLYQLRATDGEYLSYYPNGKYSKKALENITDLLEISVADMNDKAVYTPLADISERAEFNRFLTELRAIISKNSDIYKSKSLQLIQQLGEGYK